MLIQLSKMVAAVVLPLVLSVILLWYFILPPVAEFICNSVDQVAFNIALVIVMLAGFWFAGVVSGAVLYKQLDDNSNTYN